MELRQALQQAVERLTGTDTDSPRLDAELLLCHVLDKPRGFLFTWPEHRLTDAELTRFEALVSERCQGMPVAYQIGQRAFWTLTLATEDSTLIPRPDTETLVEAVLARVSEVPIDVADLGTGTGAIALALAAERPAWRVLGLDRSADAVALARRNASANDLARVHMIQSHWCDALAGNSLDVLVSNPPYIRSDDPHLVQGDVRFEPRSALVAGADGLDDIRQIVLQSVRVLRAGGWLFLEHGYDQAEDVALLLIDAGYLDTETVPDLAGQPRVTLGRRPTTIAQGF